MKRRRQSYQPDPNYCHIILDANALDRVDKDRSALVDEFERLTSELSVIKPHGVQSEISHPNTPARVRTDMGGIYTLQTNLTSDEAKRRERLRKLMTGNSNSNRHVADADHLFEASKYGGGYFVTHDKRILDRKDQLRTEALGVEAVTLAEMVLILRQT